MTSQQTLSIIKPDAVARNLIGEIYSRIERNGLRVVAARMMLLTRAQAERLYAVHRERPFYRSLVEFIASGPVMVQVLDGDDAISRYRKLMGATDPEQALPGTIRGDLRDPTNRGEDRLLQNIVHGSDSPEAARHEIDCLLNSADLCPRPA